MRILCLTPGHPAHDERVAKVILGAGHEHAIQVVPDALTDPVARMGVVRSAVARVQPDVIHAGPIQTIARVAAELGGQPLVAVSWGFDLLGDAQELRSREQAKWTLARANAVIVDCRAARKVAVELGVPAERIVTLPWGVDLDVFQPGQTRTAAEARAKVGWSEAVVVLMTRTLEPRYGVDVALEGFLAASKLRDDLRLLVVGDGSLRHALEARVAAAGALDRVRFLGQLPPEALPVQFAAADIYLSASHVDGSSVSLLEAMATGLPVVVSDIPGNREWVEPGRSGEFFEVGDPNSLTTAVMAVVNAGRDRMRSLGLRGRAIAQDRADWGANSPRLILAFELARTESVPSLKD